MPFDHRADRARPSGLSSDQLKMAATIYAVGRQMGMSTRDIQIGLITAMQESSLRNLDYGDRDSLGLFQQRPSQGWGSPEQVTDPVYATRKFFQSLKGLGDRRYDMSMTEAAQAVQRSAHPDAYAKHIPLIRRLWPDIAESGGGNPRSMDGGPYRGPQGESKGLTVPGVGPSTPGDVLGAQISGVLAAPGFEELSSQDFWSPLRPEMLEDIKDRAASRGDVRPQKGVDGWRAEVIRAAREAVGTPYVWGGNSLLNGVDCSGLIQQAFQAAGIKMPRVSYQQVNSGKAIGLGALKPGDLVGWDNSSRNNGADHVALYLGDGMIIEAPRPGLSVRIRKLHPKTSDQRAWGVRINP